MRISIFICFIAMFLNVTAGASVDVNIINNLKTKKIVLNDYIQNKLNKSKKISPLSTLDFPKRVHKLFDEFTVSLPQGYIADFNEDGRKDIVFLAKYKAGLKKGTKGVIFAAVSKGKDKYRMHEIMKFDLYSMKDTKLDKSKNDKDDQLLVYLFDQNPKEVKKKPVVLETFMGKQMKFEYKKNKFVKLNK